MYILSIESIEQRIIHACTQVQKSNNQPNLHDQYTYNNNLIDRDARCLPAEPLVTFFRKYL